MSNIIIKNYFINILYIMAQYKTFIDTIYKTIDGTTMDDASKSKIIIAEIKKIIPDQKLGSQIKKNDRMEISCSGFPNKVIQFVCKLGKYKDKLCNLPSAVTWVIGKDKIDKLIKFITANKTFADSVLQEVNNNDDKIKLTQLLDSLAPNIQSDSSQCIKDVQTFLNNLKTQLKPILLSSDRDSISSSQGETDRDSLSSSDSISEGYTNRESISSDRGSILVRDSLSDILGDESKFNNEENQGNDYNEPKEAKT